MNKNTVVVLLALIPVIIILTSTFSSDIIRIFVHKESAEFIDRPGAIFSDGSNNPDQILAKQCHS